MGERGRVVSSAYRPPARVPNMSGAGKMGGRRKKDKSGGVQDEIARLRSRSKADYKRIRDRAH
jgi:hypothetical protein